MDRLIPHKRDSPKLRPEVLQNCLLRHDLHHFFAVEHRSRLGECLLENEFAQIWFFEGYLKTKVKLMVVGLGTDLLVN